MAPPVLSMVVGGNGLAVEAMGIGVGVAIYATSDRDVLVLPEAFQQGEIVGLVVLAIVGWLLYRTGIKSKALGDVEPGPM